MLQTSVRACLAGDKYAADN